MTKFSRGMDKWGWATLKGVGGVAGAYFGGPIGSAATVAGVSAAQGFLSPKKKEMYSKSPGKALAMDALATGAAYAGGMMAGSGMGASNAAENAGSNAGNQVVSQGGSAASNAGGAGTSTVSTNVGSRAGSNLFATVPKGSYGKASGTLGNGLSKNTQPVITNSNVTALGSKGSASSFFGKPVTTKNSPLFTEKDVTLLREKSLGEGIEKGIDAGKGTNGGTGNPPPKMSTLEKYDKLSKGINAATAVAQVGMSLKGINDLKKMDAPSIGAAPNVTPQEVEDTVSSQKREGEQRIETSLANKRRIDLARGTSDSSEDAIIEMTAMNALSGNIEQARTNREQRIADERFRADSTNQGYAVQQMVQNANLQANFENMRGTMESQNLATLMSVPTQYMQSNMATQKTYSDRYNSLMNALSRTQDAKEREYLLSEIEKLKTVM